MGGGSKSLVTLFPRHAELRRNLVRLVLAWPLSGQAGGSQANRGSVLGVAWSAYATTLSFGIPVL
jgi:hypothetical protein